MSNPSSELRTLLESMTRRGCVQCVLSGNAAPLAFLENGWREDGAPVSRAALDAMLLASVPEETAARVRATSDDSVEWTHTLDGKFFDFIVVSQNGARTATITAVDERGVTLGFQDAPEVVLPEVVPREIAVANSGAPKTDKDDGAFWESVGELEAAVLAEAPTPEMSSAPANSTAPRATANAPVNVWANASAATTQNMPAQSAKLPMESAPDAMDFEVGALGLPPRRWHYEQAGKRIGPVSTGKMIDLITSKIVRRTTMVHHAEMVDWQQLKLTELDVIFERRSDLDPAMEAERLEAIDVRSSGNPYASLPGELIGINIGGLLIGPIWALGNRVLGPGLLSLLTPLLFLRLRSMIPLSNSSYDVMNPIRNIFLIAAIGLHLGFSVYYAFAGYELAWCNREWKSFAQFRKQQRLWALGGIAFVVVASLVAFKRANAPVSKVPVAAPAEDSVELPANAPLQNSAAKPAPSAAPTAQNPVMESAPDPAFEAGNAATETAPETNLPVEDLQP